jgi:UDP-perosamine 4-acetyltransferase
MAGAVVNACTSIGEGAIVNTGATIDHDCKIGNYAHVAPQCGIAGTVSVGSLAFLGVGTKVIPGITIGDKTTTGAGAVVVRDLPGESLAVGVPARIVQKNKENHK